MTRRVLCDNCGEVMTLDGRDGTKIASLQGRTCMVCYKDNEQ